GTIEERGADGRPAIVGYLPPALTGTEFFVGSSRSKADVFADIEAATRRGFALMLTSAVLAIVAAWLGARRFIRRPISELLEAAAQWRAGNYKARTALCDRGSEIDRLGLAFDAMAAALEQREADQRRGREELQVEQR